MQDQSYGNEQLLILNFCFYLTVTGLLMFLTRNETWLQWKMGAGMPEWTMVSLSINHRQQGNRYLTQKDTQLLSALLLCKPQGTFKTLTKALMPTEVTRNTVWYRVRDQEHCCHSTSVRTRKHIRWESTEGAGRQQPSALPGKAQTSPDPLLFQRGIISSCIISGNLFNPTSVNSNWEVLSTAVWPAYWIFGYDCSQKRAMGENPEAILYEETQEGGGKFLLISAVTEAVQCAIDLLQWSVWYKIAFCLKVCFAVLMHCVYALTATRCCIQVSSCISITSGHL